MKRFIVFFIVIILLFIFIFLLRGENVFFISLRPIQRSFYQTKSKSLVESDFCRSLEVENIESKAVWAENRNLRKHLNFLQESRDNYVLANIIGQRFEAGLNWFLLDKGIDQGVQSGLAVADEDGVLIGTIVESKKFVSYLRPIFDQGSCISADIIKSPGIASSGKDIVSGVIYGEYGSTIKMKYIPLDKEISIGDAVITAGLEGNIRWGIVIGQVADINKKPNAIFQQIVVKPAFNPDPRIVSIILP